MKIATCRKFHTSKSKLSLKIRETSLQILQDNKYLGVQLDEQPTWENIDLISKKLSRAIAML